MQLRGKRVAMLCEQIYEDLELWYPYHRLREEGAEVDIIAPRKGETYPSKHGYPAKADRGIDEFRAEDYDAMVIPGGFAPDHMRRTPAMVDAVRAMNAAGKPLAAICHAGWMLASAGAVKNRTVTSFFAIRDDMENAGANWVDQDVVVDGNLITSRYPGDLPMFGRAIVQTLAEAGGEQRKTA